MNDLFLQTTGFMENIFNRLERKVPSPRMLNFGDGFVFRYQEKTIHQAVVLKFARTISGLNAITILLSHGHLQEQASVNRILDELIEDIIFLSFAIIKNETTEHHVAYLDAFWAETYPDPYNVLTRPRKPVPPRRRKIRSYIRQGPA